ncbi:hypothetical protein FB451DRAFT_1464662 [Mycena latifolia]|nr:hypothetical protein FB451DRAFT_1464662 [Mycena latifolia]
MTLLRSQCPQISPPNSSLRSPEGVNRSLIRLAFETDGILEDLPASSCSICEADFKGHPCLRRTYRFHDYPSAKHFFHAVVAAILAPAPNSFPQLGRGRGGFIRGSLHGRAVLVQQACRGRSPYENKKHGISHIDVRFAIEVEAEFIKNWVGNANNVAHSARKAPTSMEELWNYQIIRGKRSKRRVSSTL